MHTERFSGKRARIESITFNYSWHKHLLLTYNYEQNQLVTVNLYDSECKILILCVYKNERLNLNYTCSSSIKEQQYCNRIISSTSYNPKNLFPSTYVIIQSLSLHKTKPLYI